MSIAGYDGKIEYIEGKENQCADLLSRILGERNPENEHEDKAEEPDIDDRTMEINIFNTNHVKSCDFATFHVEPSGDIRKATIDLTLP